MVYIIISVLLVVFIVLLIGYVKCCSNYDSKYTKFETLNDSYVFIDKNTIIGSRDCDDYLEIILSRGRDIRVKNNKHNLCVLTKLYDENNPK